MQDLWHVIVVLRYQEWEHVQRAYYIIRTDNPVTAEEAATLACVQVVKRTGLPNGEYAYALDGTAFCHQGGELSARGRHTIVFDKSIREYRHTDIKGDVVGPDPDNAEMIQYNWMRKRWDGPSN